jgi:hypothetical protein
MVRSVVATGRSMNAVEKLIRPGSPGGFPN